MATHQSSSPLNGGGQVSPNSGKSVENFRENVKKKPGIKDIIRQNLYQKKKNKKSKGLERKFSDRS